MTDTHVKYAKFGFKTLLGLVARILFISPMLYAGGIIMAAPEATGVWNMDNVVIFSVWLIAIHSVMLLICTTLIPAEYAIKTNLQVLEFNKWIPQVTSIYAFSVGCLVLGYILASGGLYWYAGVLVAYGIANITWPRYVGKIDEASKEDMINKLKGDQESVA